MIMPASLKMICSQTYAIDRPDRRYRIDSHAAWGRKSCAIASVNVEISIAEQPDQPGNDQVDRNNVVKQTGYDQDQYSRDERDDRRETECHVQWPPPIQILRHAKAKSLHCLCGTERTHCVGFVKRLRFVKMCVRMRTDVAVPTT